jgi:hypothetical protein
MKRKSFIRAFVSFPVFLREFNLIFESSPSNTSTVALRLVGGDEKGTQCLGV